MLRRVLFASAALWAACASAHAQQGVTRAVPSNRADQEAPAVRERQAPGPQQQRNVGQAPNVTPFVLSAVSVTGSTLPPEVLRAAYAPFIGQTLDGAGIQRLSDAIAQAYSRTDIALFTITIPDQDLTSGALRVEALEGRITAVEIDRQHAGRATPLVEAYGRRLAAERPLRKSTLQREVSLIRDLPGVRTDMELVNGEGPDAVVLRLDPKLQPVQFAFAVNNRGTVFLGKTQVQADLFLNSFLRAGDQTKFTYAAPTEDDLFRFAAVSHLAPIGSDGNTLLLNASYLKTNPATTALEGVAKTAGLQFTRPIIRSYERDLFVTVGIDGVNSDNALFGTVFSDDRTRAARLAAAYTRTREKSLGFIVGSVSRGVDGLGARTFAPAFTELEFTKFNLRVGFNYLLTEQAVLRLKAQGQYSRDALPGSEQIALGGMDYGRAYESAIISGDRGYAASAELAYRPSRLPDAIAGSEIYGFVDGGEVTYLARAGFANSAARLSSAGAGVRLTIRSKAVLEVEATRGLNNRIAFLDDRDWRGVVSLKTLF